MTQGIHITMSSAQYTFGLLWPTLLTTSLTHTTPIIQLSVCCYLELCSAILFIENVMIHQAKLYMF